MVDIDNTRSVEQLVALRQQSVALQDLILGLQVEGDLAPRLDALVGALQQVLGAADGWFTVDEAVLMLLGALPAQRLRSNSTDTALCIPLAHAGTDFGAFYFLEKADGQPFSPEALVLARHIVDQMATLIAQTQQQRLTEQRLARAEALRDIAHTLSTELDLDRALMLIHEQVLRLIKHQNAWVALYDELSGNVAIPFYVTDGGRRLDRQQVLQPLGKGMVWELLNGRQSINTENYYEECARRDIAPTVVIGRPLNNIIAWLGVPLFSSGRLVGAMAIQRLDVPFDADDQQLLELLAGQIAIAIENAQLYTEARRLASVDPLTGLTNHRRLYECLDEEIAIAARKARPLAIIMIDLDNFKYFNETYGHPVGDQALRIVADVLRAEVRPTDILGRFGGDEFMAILPGTDAVAATAFMTRIQTRLKTHSPLFGETSPTPLFLSAGIAVFPHDALTRSDLFMLADSALYTSKRSGRATVVTAGIHPQSAALLAHTSFGVVEGLVLAVDAKDSYTAAHSNVVAEVAELLAVLLNLPEHEQVILRTAGLLHDVGKISIPDRILRKPAPLTPEEWAIMRRHVEFSELIIRGVPGLQDILDPIRHHHERWDGKGYPLGLVGEEVPLLGRIMVIADAYSAMTLDRPYRPGMTVEEALNEIAFGAGIQFDPYLATVLCTPAVRQILERSAKQSNIA